MNGKIVQRLGIFIIPVALAGGVTLGAGGTAFADGSKGTDHPIGQASHGSGDTGHKVATKERTSNYHMEMKPASDAGAPTGQKESQSGGKESTSNFHMEKKSGACHYNCVSHGWTKIGRRDYHSAGKETICEDGHRCR